MKWNCSSCWLFLLLLRWSSPSQALSEWSAWVPGWRGGRWPFHRHWWQHAAEIRHSPAKSQPLWRWPGGPLGPKGEEGKGQPSGASDRKERRAEDKQWRTLRQFRGPPIPKPIHLWIVQRHQPLPSTLHAQVLDKKNKTFFRACRMLYIKVGLVGVGYVLLMSLYTSFSNCFQFWDGPSQSCIHNNFCKIRAQLRFV